MIKNNGNSIKLLALVIILIISFVGCEEEKGIVKDDVARAEKIIGLNFTDSERDSLIDDLKGNLEAYESLRNLLLENSVPPSLNFNPVPVGFEFKKGEDQLILSKPTKLIIPENIEDLAFYSVRDLAELVKTRKVSSMQLTKMYLKRLKKYDEQLHCVITFTEELALKQAQQADDEIASGNYRGPLHGIPYGVKDLLSVEGYKTTWGAMPYNGQRIDETAIVVDKLEEAGAVLIAKLSLGALAWGDVWFDGKTRNPWNTEQGSSGSSAGPASATSAGLVAFSIGSETWGSIVSPSTRCGNTGLRPTYGRVSRTGAMALSWTMDKLGPICRTVEDAAIVFNTIKGPDNIDQTLVDAPFRYNANKNINKLRVGYLKSAFEEDYPSKEFDTKTLDVLKELGVELVAIELPDLPIAAMGFILSAEAAAAFDDLTRNNEDDLMVRQIKNAWPNVFRSSRFIPAVEYIQANRLRYAVIQEMKSIFENIDLYVAPSFVGDNLLLTNLTGHPCVVLPNGFNDDGTPVSISFIGNLFEEGELLEFAKKYQDATDFHKQFPPLYK